MSKTACIFLRNKRVFVLLLLLVGVQATAQKIDPANLLIRNVFTITNSNDSSAIEVNILILDNILKIVSTEDLKQPDKTVALDAKGGYVLGNLTLNKPPEFVILKEDPRKSFNVWLDFESSLIFAIEDGVIHRNRLNLNDESKPKEKEPDAKVQWFAYTPPPFALPISYGDANKWNYWDTEKISGVFTGAIGLDRLFWLSQNESSESQHGDLKSNEGGEIRGLRMGVIGKLKFFKRPWSYTVFIATQAFDKGFEESGDNSVKLFDFRLDIPLGDRLVLSVGKQKEPISLERIPSSLFNQMQERVSDAFLPARNFGLQLSGNLLDNRMSWAAAAFNSFIENPGSFADNETILMGRITGVVYEKNGKNLIHVGVSNRYSDGKNGAKYGIRPEFNKSDPFIETELIETSRMNLVATELSYLNGPFWVFSEFTLNQLFTPANGLIGFNSLNITGSWILTGEGRTYRYQNGTINPIPVAIGVNQGGWGAWELAARISSYDLNKDPIFAGNMDIYSLGLNWWLTNSASFSINYRKIVTAIDGAKGHSDGINTRLLLLLD